MTTIHTLLQEGVNALEKSPSPRLDAELLLSFVTGSTRTLLIGFSERTVADSAAEKFRELVARRAEHEPIAYLTGTKEFYGLDFEVTPAVLIPRPETELIVEKGLQFLSNVPGHIRILDLGTGSGCIALSFANHARTTGRRFEITAVDKSSAALDVARRNAERHQLCEAVNFIESDWFQSVPTRNAFHLIVANPPYIAEGSKFCGPETTFEPSSALFAGTSGLSDFEIIFRDVPTYLAQQGLFLSEIGADQAEAVLALWPQLHPNLPARADVLIDLAGRNRIFSLGRT